MKDHIDIDDLPEERMTALVPQTEISDIVNARDAALERITAASEALKGAFELSDQAKELASRAKNGRSFYGVDRTNNPGYGALFRPHAFDTVENVEIFRKDLDSGVWTYLLERTGMKDMMDAQAKKEFSDSLAQEVPEVTTENIRATFQSLMGDADNIFKRGLANAFCNLDRRFKSHDGFKIGSRIILHYAFSEYGGSFSYGSTRDTIIDIERVFAKVEGRAPDPNGLMGAIEDSRRGGGYGPKQSECESRYFRIRGFKNGNAHLWFTRDDLVEKVNKLLADWYGEVIPDAAPYEEKAEDFATSSTAVAKDLQFYPTPILAAEFALDGFHIGGSDRVLEPSAGEGNLARVILQKQPNARIDCVEIDPRRIERLKEIGKFNSVVAANFLRIRPQPIYDVVVMNPPFYGTHWMKHVRHAWDFLKPGGRLLAILPVTAETGESKRHEQFREFVQENQRYNYRMPFRDLPEGSFRSSGTNINTVVVTLSKKKD